MNKLMYIFRDLKDPAVAPGFALFISDLRPLRTLMLPVTAVVENQAYAGYMPTVFSLN